MTIDEAISRYENNAEYERTHESLQGCLEFRQLAAWLKELQAHKEAWEKCIKEIKEWYCNADKQAIAKDPCVVDAMVDLFIRTMKECRPKEGDNE